MPKGLIFFCCACCILLLTIINLSIAPIISGKVGDDEIDGYDYFWGTANCVALEDIYDDAKKEYNLDSDQKKYLYERNINQCKRKKAMHDMEYTAFVFDIVIGFVCGLLGLLHLFGLKRDSFFEITGLIGLCCGGVGFILTFVYVIFNGLVYTNYYTGDGIYKVDSEGAFAEWKNGKYECLFYKKSPLNTYSFYATYSDLGKQQYNYNKDLKKDLDSINFKCKASPEICEGKEDLANEYGYDSLIKYGDNNDIECKKIYYINYSPSGLENKDISDRFLTTLILSLLVCLASIGLSLFGLLIAKSGEF